MSEPNGASETPRPDCSFCGKPPITEHGPCGCCAQCWSLGGHPYALAKQSPEQNSATNTEKDTLMDEVVTRIVADLVEQQRVSDSSGNAPEEAT